MHLHPNLCARIFLLCCLEHLLEAFRPGVAFDRHIAKRLVNHQHGLWHNIRCDKRRRLIVFRQIIVNDGAHHRLRFSRERLIACLIFDQAFSELGTEAS
jgi:hypothetical protein